jgi:hypothetical protein
VANYNKDFDFTEFATGVLATVDGLRSQGKGQAANSPEPRINAFYRALGLPAILPGLSGSEQFLDGNIFNTTSDVVLKDEDLISMYQRVTPASVQPTAIEMQNMFNNNTVSVLDSIKYGSGRPNLFPMYVDGTIPVFPQSRRVAAAFLATEQRTALGDSNAGVVYHVPFLEFVIGLRLSSIGWFNSVINNNAVMNDVYVEFAEAAQSIIKDLVLSLSNVATTLTDIKQTADKARGRTNTTVTPTNIPVQNPETDVDPSSRAALDVAQQNQQAYLALKQARMSIFNFDDSVLTNVGQPSTRNLKDALFASPFISMAMSDGGTIVQAQDETDQKVEKVTSSLKSAFMNLDYIFGTYSGLAATDVMAVILGLFTMKIDSPNGSLIGLLNDDALANLNIAYGTAQFTRDNFGAVSASVTTLQDRISTIYDQLNTVINDPKAKSELMKAYISAQT